MITTLTVNPAIDLTLEVDGLLIEDVNRVKSFREDMGGKGINVSRVLKELGYAQTTTIAVLGGTRGERFKGYAKAGRLKLLPIGIKNETRINITVYNRSKRKTTKLNQPGPSVSGSDARGIWKECIHAASRSEFFVISGSLVPGLKSDWYGKLIKGIRRECLFTVLDADGEALEKALGSQPFLIKPNRFEAERALGRKLSSERALWWAGERMRSMGAQNVIISLGGEGVLFCGQNERWRGYSIPVKINSTIGAGDAFLAGFVYQLANGKGFGEALRFGIACGTHTVITGVSELCSKSEVYQLLPKIKVKEV